MCAYPVSLPVEQPEDELGSGLQVDLPTLSFVGCTNPSLINTNIRW